MTRFSYRAVSAAGVPQTGEIEAGSAAEVAARLREAGQLPLAVTAAGGARQRGRRPALGGRGPVDLGLLTGSLATLLNAGVTLEEALRAIAELAPGSATADLALALRGDLRGGLAFAAALERRPEHFAAHHVGLVRAGEASARLGEVMAELAELERRLGRVAAQVRSALIYPACLLATALAAVAFILVGVLPRFAELIEQGGGAELPPATRAAIDLGLWLEAHGRAVLLAASLAVAAVLATPARAALARAVRDRLLSLPGVAGVRRDADTARVARTLAVLLDAGSGLLPALEITRAGAKATATRAALASAIAGLRQGRGLAETLAASAAFPPLIVQLVAVGERSGRLAPMLLEAAKLLEEGVERGTERLLALLTPLLTVLLGAVVALLVAPMMAALTSLYGTVG